MKPCSVCHESSVKIHVPHPSDREYFVRRKVSSSYYRCTACHSIEIVPRPDFNETGTFYSVDYQNYSKSNAPLISKLFDLLQLISLRGIRKTYRLDAHILDFGCNQGQFLKMLHSAGYRNLNGYDVVPQEVEPGQVYAFYSDLVELSASGKKFDIIRLNHVIEHLPDVDATMRTLASLLTPTGKIIGQMPNAGHYTSWLFGSFWGPLHFPYHLTLFSDQGLKKNAPVWGLTALTCRPTIVPTGWAMSFENILKPILCASRRGRSPFYIILLFLSTPFVVFDRLFSSLLSTAIIDFELQKRHLP